MPHGEKLPVWFGYLIFAIVNFRRCSKAGNFEIKFSKVCLQWYQMSKFALLRFPTLMAISDFAGLLWYYKLKYLRKFRAVNVGKNQENWCFLFCSITSTYTSVWTGLIFINDKMTRLHLSNFFYVFQSVCVCDSVLVIIWLWRGIPYHWSIVLKLIAFCLNLLCKSNSRWTVIVSISGTKF